MGSVLVVSGDMAPGSYLVREIALGISRLELLTPAERWYGVLGGSTLGEGVVCFTAHLLDGGRFEGVTDRVTYERLLSFVSPL